MTATFGLVLGSLIGFVTSICGYIFADISILAAFGIYLAIPAAAVVICAAVQAAAPRRPAETRLVPAE